MYSEVNSYTKGFIRKFYKNVPVTLLCKSSKTTLQDMSQNPVVGGSYQQAKILDLEYSSQNAPMVIDEVQDQDDTFLNFDVLSPILSSTFLDNCVYTFSLVIIFCGLSETSPFHQTP